MRDRSPISDVTTRDRGMTLPEVLISVVLMSVVSVVIVAAIAVTLRTIPRTEATTDEAVILQGVVTFLPPDVDAAIPGSFDIDPAKASGCAGPDEGTSLVHMRWEERLYGSTTTFVANYRYVESAGTARIVRVFCSGVGTLGPPQTRLASGELPALPPGWVPGDAPIRVTLADTVSDLDTDTLTDQVNFTVTTLTGELLFVETASKNPDDTAPPTSLFSFVTTTSTSTTTTSTTTTTTIAPSTSLGETTTTTSSTTSTSSTSTTTTLVPCEVTGMSVSPSSVKRKNNPGLEFQDDVVVSITVNPATSCVGLTLQYTGVSNTESPRNFPTTSPTKTITIPKGTAEDWEPGTYTLRVMDNTNTQRASATLTVTN